MPHLHSPLKATMKSPHTKSALEMRAACPFVVAQIGPSTIYPASTCVLSFIIMLPSTGRTLFHHFTGLVAIFV